MLARITRSRIFGVLIGVALLAFMVWDFVRSGATWESLTSPWVLIGLFVGASLPFLIAWVLMKAVPKSSDEDQSEPVPSKRR